ncbi:MAG: SapC family protein [Alphaproteobacteria bacterium]
MFGNLEALDRTKHLNLRLVAQNRLDFAADLMTAPLAGSEMVEMARHCPIVFPMEDCVPQALMSLGGKRNAFLDDQARWTGGYLPAHIRRYPFILTEDKGRTFVLIERNAPHFSETEGERLFEDDGQPTKVLQQTIEYLTLFQAEGRATRALFQRIADAGLLIEQEIKVEDAAGKAHRINGLRAISREKLDAVADETFLEWRKIGLLPLLYAHLSSLSNISRIAHTIN